MVQHRGITCRHCGYDEWYEGATGWRCGGCGEPELTSSARRSERDRKPKDKRSFGHWSRNPDAIIDDPNLGAAEKAVAAAIARKINWGKWNKYLSADISQSALGRLAGIRSRHGVREALDRLEKAGYIRWVGLPGRGGSRFWFTEKCR